VTAHTSAPAAVPAAPADPDDLFLCEHLVKTLARKHCVRRQLERKQTKHPRTMKIVAGAPANGHCATGCAQGRAVKASLAHVPSGSCEHCGTAYVGAAAATAPCEECSAARMEARDAPPATGFLPPQIVPVTTRVWNGEAPDVAIGAPPSAKPPAPAPAARELAPEPTQPPTHPAPVDTEETTMSCPDCKSPSRHRSDCPRNPEKNTAKPTAPTKTAPTTKAAKPPPSKPAPKAPALRVPRAAGAGDLPVLSVAELLDLRRAIDAEIRGRLEAIEAERAALLEAVSADAQLLERVKAA
jgi:hypothetical protein